MRAAVMTKLGGGPETLAIHELADPEVGAWDVLVDVRASALNRADLLQRRGMYPAPRGVLATVPGLELAGVVIGVGAHVSRWRVGDRVMAIVGGAANATRVALHEREAMRMPAGLDFVDAAAIPEAFMTAYDAAVLQGGLAAGQWVAVNAVGSGVGTAAVQLAKAIGARVIGSSRTAAKIDKAKDLGLDHGGADLVAVAQQAGVSCAVLLDLVGGPPLAQALGVLRPRGVAMLVGMLAGPSASLPLLTILQRRLCIRGTVLRSRPLEEKLAAAITFEDQVVPLFERGLLHPVVDRVLPLGDIAEGHRVLEASDTFGKVVLDHA